MNKKIVDLVDRIFECSIYSKTTTDAKKKITKKFENKYEELRQSDNDIIAFGKLMSQYGTIDKAGKLAGYTDDEIKQWTDDSRVISKREFAKGFFKTRLQLYIFSLFLSGLICIIPDLFIYKWYGNLLNIIIDGAMLSLVAILLVKKRHRESLGDLGFEKDGKDYIEKYSDRYSKRLLNSICMTVAGVFFILYMVINSVVNGGMTWVETITSTLTGTMGVRLVIYILFKNISCRYWISLKLDGKINEEFKKYSLLTLASAVAYWIVIGALMILLRNHMDAPFNWLIVAIVGFFIIVIVCNLTLRKKVVFNNVTVNLRRSIVIGLCAVVICSYQVMKMDSFLLQPYISRVSAVNNQPDVINYNDDSGVYTITSDKKDFKILQLTDIHLGGSPVSVIKDYEALEACDKLINKTQPDLVVVTGDLVFPVGMFSFSFNNTAPIIEFANYMRNKGVPWAFTYGNHDTELYASGSRGDVIYTFESLSYQTSGNLLYPYKEPDITGRNNQMIELRNSDGGLNQALFLIDSNDYVDGVKTYDYIHDDQVEWYENQVKELNKNEGKHVSSLLFFHMPLQEYRTAYELYEKGSDKVKYFFGENKEKMFDKVCCSKYPSKIFDTAKELGSSKAMFCGHDHYNNLSVEYEGIRLTYGMSIDYLAMPGIDKDTAQRGGTLITCHSDSTYDIEQIKLSAI